MLIRKIENLEAHLEKTLLLERPIIPETRFPRSPFSEKRRLAYREDRWLKNRCKPLWLPTSLLPVKLKQNVELSKQPVSRGTERSRPRRPLPEKLKLVSKETASRETETLESPLCGSVGNLPRIPFAENVRKIHIKMSSWESGVGLLRQSFSKR